MSARVTAAEVRAIIRDADTDMVGDTLAPFIMMATKLTDRVVAADDDDVMDAELLKEVERLLAAHFTCLKYTRVSDEKAGTVGESVQYKVGLRLEVTMYGQQALVLDLTGTLAGLNAGTGGAVAEVLSLNPTMGWRGEMAEEDTLP